MARLAYDEVPLPRTMSMRRPPLILIALTLVLSVGALVHAADKIHRVADTQRVTVAVRHELDRIRPHLQQVPRFPHPGQHTDLGPAEPAEETSQVP